MSGGMQTVRVISHLAVTLQGRFDGEDFVFRPEKPTDLSLDAARHIFGLGEEDKSSALNKLGLLIPGKHTLQEALEALEKITFLEAQVVFPDEDEPDPAPRGRRTTPRIPPSSAGVSGEPGDPQGSPGASD